MWRPPAAEPRAQAAGTLPMTERPWDRKRVLPADVELAVTLHVLTDPVDRREIVPETQHGVITERFEQLEDRPVAGLRRDLEWRALIQGRIASGFVQGQAAEQQGFALAVADESMPARLQGFLAMP